MKYEIKVELGGIMMPFSQVADIAGMEAQIFSSRVRAQQAADKLATALHGLGFNAKVWTIGIK